MLHALLGAWLLVLALLAITAAAAAYRMPDVRHPGPAARLSHAFLIAWSALGLLAFLGHLVWEVL